MKFPDRYEHGGRKLMVEFQCRRCKKTSLRPLKQCMDEVDYNFMTDLRPPDGWFDGGSHYPLFCPECKEKVARFMAGAELADESSS